MTTATKSAAETIAANGVTQEQMIVAAAVGLHVGMRVFARRALRREPLRYGTVIPIRHGSYCQAIAVLLDDGQVVPAVDSEAGPGANRRLCGLGWRPVSVEALGPSAYGAAMAGHANSE